MSYLNSDGSGLLGALNPSNIGQALQVDASGNLKVTDKYNAAILNAISYISTTGLVAGPGTTNQTVAFSFFVPNTTTKNILLYSLQACGGQGTLNHVRSQTIDPAFANAITPVNLKIGGGNSVLANITYANTSQSFAGTEFQPVGIPPNTSVECLTYPILIPEGSAWGLVVYMFLGNASSNWAVSARHYEF